MAQTNPNGVSRIVAGCNRRNLTTGAHWKVRLALSLPTHTIGSTWGYSKAEGAIKTTVYARTLQKAAELLGGGRALVHYLRVPMEDLIAWTKPDGSRPPFALFLKAVDLVMKQLGDKERQLAQRLRVASTRNSLTTL